MNNKFIGRKDVEKTPFSIIEFEDKTKIIALGNHRISKRNFKSEKAAIEYINSKPWEILINTMFASAEMYLKIQNAQHKNEKEINTPQKTN